jgi:hypothetical protein
MTLDQQEMILTSRKNSLELIELSSITKVCLDWFMWVSIWFVLEEQDKVIGIYQFGLHGLI